MEVVPDDFSLIEDRLNHFVDERCDLVFTTGGTGMTPDDITPEATRVVIHREAPGLAEAMRAESARHTPLGILTRGIAGISEATLIVNFPGSPKAVEQLFPVIAPGARARGRDAPRRVEPWPPPRRLRSRRSGAPTASGSSSASSRFTLPAGATVAVFGANGAGKTTLLRILAGLLRPHAGEARVLGAALPKEAWKVRGRIGLLGHEPLLYRDLTVRENLRFHARLHDVPEARAAELVERVGLRGARRRPGAHAQPRHGPARRDLPRAAARAGPAAARRAAREPRPGRRGGRRAAAARAGAGADLARRGGRASRAADWVLGLRGGRQAIWAPAADVTLADVRGLYR